MSSVLAWAGKRAGILTDSWQLCQPMTDKLRFWKNVSTNDRQIVQSCHSVDNIEWEILKSVIGDGCSVLGPGLLTARGPQLCPLYSCVSPGPALLGGGCAAFTMYTLLWDHKFLSQFRPTWSAFVTFYCYLCSHAFYDNSFLVQHTQHQCLDNANWLCTWSRKCKIFEIYCTRI